MAGDSYFLLPDCQEKSIKFGAQKVEKNRRVTLSLTEFFYRPYSGASASVVLSD